MKDKLSKPDKMMEALDSLDQYINNLIKKHDQEMQKVVAEKDERISLFEGMSKDDDIYICQLRAKVKQLEQQIKESREVSLYKLLEALPFDYTKVEKDKDDVVYSRRMIEETIFNLINGDKQ